MTNEEVKAIFLLSGLGATSFYEIKNEYYSSSGEPWWLVRTEFGLIKIGWRKRVINIDWTDTGLVIDEESDGDYEFHKRPISNDDTTKWESGIHAWGYAKAVEYITNLKVRLGQHQYATSEEGKIDLEKRKALKLAKQREDNV